MTVKVMQIFTTYSCINSKCLSNTEDRLLETCSYKCENSICIEAVCTENEIKYFTCPDGSKVEECLCVSNEWKCIKSPELYCITEPDEPTPGGFTKFITKIIDWFKNIFASIFMVEQSVIGPKTVEPNTVHTYQFDITVTMPDSNYSDGVYQIQYANWALLDSDGNIIQEGTWEKVNGVYSKSVTITTPSNIGEFALLGIITHFNMTWDTTIGQWETGEEYIVNKEAIDLKTEHSITEPEEPIPGGFTKFITDIINWVKNLWGSLFG